MFKKDQVKVRHFARELLTNEGLRLLERRSTSENMYGSPKGISRPNKYPWKIWWYTPKDFKFTQNSTSKFIPVNTKKTLPTKLNHKTSKREEIVNVYRQSLTRKKVKQLPSSSIQKNLHQQQQKIRINPNNPSQKNEGKFKGNTLQKSFPRPVKKLRRKTPELKSDEVHKVDNVEFQPEFATISIDI